MGMKRFSLSRFSLHANKGEEQKIKNMIDLNSIYKEITLLGQNVNSFIDDNIARLNI